MISPALRSSGVSVSKGTTTLGRSFQRDYGERERDVEERESGILSLSLPCSRRSSSPSHARDRAGRGVESRGERTPFSVSLSLSPRRASTRLRRAGPVDNPSRGSSVDSDTRSARAIHPPFLLRGSYTRRWARARAAPRDHGRYAVDPRAAAAARNRVNASPVVLLVHLGRRPGRRETAGLSSSLVVVDRFIHDSPRIRGGAASRARSSRANVQRSLVRARQVRRRASSLWLLKRPSARRGPGIVSVDRNVRSKCRCSCVLQFTS